MGKFPNFMIVGSHKCGTTSIYYYMKEHSQVFVPEEKEPFFFNVFDKKIEEAQRIMYPIKADRIVYSLDNYRTSYKRSDNYKAIGDFSPTYLLYSETTIENIKKIYGENYKNIKIIIVLRNPIEAAFSNHLMVWSRNEERYADMSQLLETYKQRVEQGQVLYSNIYSFLYYNNVKNYIDNFKEVKLILFDDLKANTKKTMEDIFKFLDINELEIIRNINNRYNQGKNHQRDPFTFNNRGYIVIKNMFKKVIAEKTYESLRLKLVKLSNKAKKPILDNKTKIMLKDFYREDIKKTSELIGRDLCHWLEI